ncbi:MAG: hypothetical protein IJX88_05265 [Clostridia bacterium]|nr:hypothetical protein [Clostridia bacterium]
MNVNEMQEKELAELSDRVFETDYVQEIAIGYAKIALDGMNYDGQTVEKFAKIMKNAMRLHTTRFARQICARKDI